MRILIGVSRRLGEVGYNSAMAIAPASLPVFYNKVKLMPFTEYAPPPVGEWLQVLGVARRSLQIGTHPHAIRLYGEPPVGTLICYESLFGWVGAKQVRDGAQWLVAMTNDQWLLGAGGSRTACRLLRAACHRDTTMGSTRVNGWTYRLFQPAGRAANYLNRAS